MSCKGKSIWARLLWPCLILSATSGCVTDLTDPAPASSYCAIAAAISYDSTADTAETVAQIEAHNSKFVCVCEGDCPAVNPAKK
jgi:hypothetical protein